MVPLVAHMVPVLGVKNAKNEKKIEFLKRPLANSWRVFNFFLTDLLAMWPSSIQLHPSPIILGPIFDFHVLTVYIVTQKKSIFHIFHMEKCIFVGIASLGGLPSTVIISTTIQVFFFRGEKEKVPKIYHYYYS